MTTKTTTATKSVKLIGGVYLAATGLKKGTKGRVTPPADFLRMLPKGERRAVRKAAYKAGRYDIASA